VQGLTARAGRKGFEELDRRVGEWRRIARRSAGSAADRDDALVAVIVRQPVGDGERPTLTPSEFASPLDGVPIETVRAEPLVVLRSDRNSARSGRMCGSHGSRSMTPGLRYPGRREDEQRDDEGETTHTHPECTGSSTQIQYEQVIDIDVDPEFLQKAFFCHELADQYVSGWTNVWTIDSPERFANRHVPPPSMSATVVHP
jgi:hypothetical protein